MPSKKLSFYGDSLMLPRRDVVKSDQIYPRLIENWLRQKDPAVNWEVLQRACSSHPITEIAEWMASDECYFAEVKGGIAVIHAGIVDAAPRPLNQKMRKLVGMLPEMLKKQLIRFLHHQRAHILRLGLGSVITPIDRFENAARGILKRACSTHDNVFLITICPTNAATEEHSPGLTRNINAYNNLWSKLTAEQSTAANACVPQLIDAQTCIASQPDIDHWISKEDGHHITPAMHRWIANKIIQILETHWQPSA